MTDGLPAETATLGAVCSEVGQFMSEADLDWAEAGDVMHAAKLAPAAIVIQHVGYDDDGASETVFGEDGEWWDHDNLCGDISTGQISAASVFAMLTNDDLETHLLSLSCQTCQDECLKIFGTDDEPPGAPDTSATRSLPEVRDALAVAYGGGADA